MSTLNYGASTLNHKYHIQSEVSYHTYHSTTLPSILCILSYEMRVLLQCTARLQAEAEAGRQAGRRQNIIGSPANHRHHY